MALRLPTASRYVIPAALAVRAAERTLQVFAAALILAGASSAVFAQGRVQVHVQVDGNAAQANPAVEIDGQVLEFDFQVIEAPARPAPANNGAAAAGNDESKGDQYLEESDRAAVLLDRIQKAFDAGDVDMAASFVQEVLAIGPEAVLPDSGQGVGPALRRLLYALSADVRKRYEDMLSPAPGDAVYAARERGTPGAYAGVMAAFPGTAAARQAAAALWAMAFEGGQFERTLEAVSVYLADPLVGGAERRQALFASGLAAVYLGRRAEAGEILAALKDAGTGDLTFGGSRVDPAATLERLLGRVRDDRRAWPNVGGTPARNGVAATGLSAGGPFVFAKDGERDLSMPATDYVPTRKEILSTRRVMQDVPTEHVVLVTPERVLAVRGRTLLALGRLSGERLWQLDIVPSGMRIGFVSWPSSGDGYVAAMRWRYPTASRTGRPLASGRAQAMARQLVVLHESTGRPAWIWDGRVADPTADLWSTPLGAAEVEAGPQTMLPFPGGGEEPILRDFTDLDLGNAAAPSPGALQRMNRATAAQPVRQLEPVGSPLIYGGRVFVGATRLPQAGPLTDTFLLCFDLASGRLLWQRFIGSGMMTVYGRGGNSLDRLIPATDGHRVYAESPAGTITAIDLATGEVAWARRLPRPGRANPWRARRANWPTGIADAPMVVGNRLLLTELDGPALRCLDTATGDILWSGVPMGRAWRLGVADGKLFVATGASLVAHDVATGAQVLRATLPYPVTGRGFVAADAVYLPTEGGIVRADWHTPEITVLYEYEQGETPSLALAPIGDGLVSSHDDRTLLFGPVDEFFGEVERGHAAHPDDPAWSRRLAELYRQKGDFGTAESHLGEAVTLAARMADAERSRDEQLLAYRCLGRLYRQWAQALGRQGDTDGAVAKLDRALTYATSPAARVVVWLTLAEHYETQGNPSQALVEYGRVAEHSVAHRMFVPTRTPGLERSVAEKAAEAVERLRHAVSTGPVADKGILRDSIDRLTVRRLGMLSWSVPSFTVCDENELLSPVLWSRSDGLVALGLGGEIRWRYTRPEGISNVAASVVMNDHRVFEKRPEELSVRRLRDGELLWRWLPGQGRMLAGVDTLFGVNVQRFIRRVQVINGVVQNLMVARSSAAPRYADFAVTDKQVVVVTSTASRTSLVVHGLDKASGAELWRAPLLRTHRFARILSEGDNVVVVAQSTRTELQARCLDAASGRTQWEYRGDAERRQPPRCLLQGGLFVMVSGAGRAAVIDVRSGKVVWKSLGAYDLWRGSVPVAVLEDKIILTHADGHVALSRDEGKVLWQVRATNLDPTGSGVGPQVAVMAGGMLVASLGDSVAAIDPADGTPVWRHAALAADAGAFRLFVLGDMVVAYESRSLTATLVFLDLPGGKLLGELALGACTGGLRVVPVRGGLFAQNGKEILSIVPDGAAPSPDGLPGA